MHAVFDDSGLARCLASGSHRDCSDVQSAFESRFATLRQLVPFFMVLPLLVGLFWERQGIVPVAYVAFALALGVIRRHFLAPVTTKYVPLPGVDVNHPGAWVFSVA